MGKEFQAPRKGRSEIASLGLAIFGLLATWIPVSLPVAEMQYPLLLDFDRSLPFLAVGSACAFLPFAYRHPKRLGLDLVLSILSVVFVVTTGLTWNFCYAFLIVGVG